PRTPAPGRERADANQFSFPTSLLIYTLIGLDPAEVSAEYRRDWMGGDPVLLALPRTRCGPLDSPSHDVESRRYGAQQDRTALAPPARRTLPARERPGEAARPSCGCC